LAEGSLLDLIASTMHHARRLERIRWFGRLAGIVEDGEGKRPTRTSDGEI
jgi:hypothetical protein